MIYTATFRAEKKSDSSQKLADKYIKSYNGSF